MQNIAIERLTIPTTQRSEMVDITDRINAFLRIKRVTSGYVIVYSPHTTAGVCINENADPDVKRDVLQKLEAMIPKSEAFYNHAEGNSDSHVKTILTGNSVMILIEAGKLVLGQWQGIYLCDFDGPRKREVLVKLISLDPVASD